MNVEVLETTNNECYVIGDDAKVRRLTKVNPDGNFKDVLDYENDIEELENNRAKEEKKCENLAQPYLVVWGIIILAILLPSIVKFIIGLSTSLDFAIASANDFFIKCGMFFGFVGAAFTVSHLILDLIDVCIAKRRIAKLNKKIKSLTKKLNILKTDNKVKEEVLSNNTINSDLAIEMSKVAEKDSSAQKVIAENNYRLLRQYQRDYLKDTYVEEKGFTYSLRRK